MAQVLTGSTNKATTPQAKKWWSMAGLWASTLSVRCQRCGRVNRGQIAVDIHDMHCAGPDVFTPTRFVFGEVGMWFHVYRGEPLWVYR